MIFWSHMGQDAFRLAVEHKIGKMGSDWIWLFSFTSFENPLLLLGCWHGVVGLVYEALEFNRLHRTVPLFQALERHDGNPVVVHEGASNHKAVEYLVAMELKGNGIDTCTCQIALTRSQFSLLVMHYNENKCCLLQTIWHHISAQILNSFRECAIFIALSVLQD